jgi:predicted DNA-binding transcriptional regulator AlpA
MLTALNIGFIGSVIAIVVAIAVVTLIIGASSFSGGFSLQDVGQPGPADEPTGSDDRNHVESGAMRIEDIAAFLGCSMQRVVQLVVIEGFPPPFQTTHGKRLWLHSEIETWAHRHWLGHSVLERPVHRGNSSSVR